jgi:hypothetical protein
MERGIHEAGWKLFRQLQPLALERFCQRVLAEVARLAAEASKSHHERYLAVYRLLQRRDEELADAFNNPRRSTALVQLARIHFHEFLSADEFARFNSETRASVERCLEMWRAQPTGEDTEIPG